MRVVGDHSELSGSYGATLRLWGDVDNQGYITAWGATSANPANVESLERVPNLADDTRIDIRNEVIRIDISN